MRNMSKGLSGVLSHISEALIYTAANLRDSRVRKPVEEKINAKQITTFQQLFDLVS
jgi:hypothetical protein